MMKRGIFIISLDFELNWGVHDVFSLEMYKENLLGVREAIPRMLEVFNQFEIHVTWATVGMLCLENKKELLSNLPILQPRYKNATFSPYGKLDAVGENEEQDPIHFGSSLVKEIVKYPNQELATHTFSHYYCLEKGQTMEEFEADLKASLKVLNVYGHPAKSLVFPRNQINLEYLQVCKEYGVQSFRGNEKSWVYKESPFNNRRGLKRILRLADSYLNIFGHHTYPIQKVDIEPIVDLPSSRFLRPYNTTLQVLEPIRLKRIKKSITNAAKNGEVFHLWWHPHNFGKDLDMNMKFLTEILNHVSNMRDEYNFKSLTMGEACTLALQLNTR